MGPRRHEVLARGIDAATGYRQLVNDSYFGLSLYESYDSEPPTAEAVRNDWGLATTVGYCF